MYYFKLVMLSPTNTNRLSCLFPYICTLSIKLITQSRIGDEITHWCSIKGNGVYAVCKLSFSSRNQYSLTKKNKKQKPLPFFTLCTDNLTTGSSNSISELRGPVDPPLPLWNHTQKKKMLYTVFPVINVPHP